MGRPELDLVIPEKCSHCKLKDVNKCEGRGVIKGAVLVICPFFIDKRSGKIINEDVKAPFPIKRTVKK